eukprot:TRINITY_DN731_c0_g2_i5.p1 TRINITY_DN731_c0_g2~~TRINITY_DN731_c0_g2_i5.p1  ORF type:complete len:874 (+),score=276.68 TRINITY_DN731_c0_g2_i5:384-2624(+)
MSCATVLDAEKLGDPAWGCGKDYKVKYKCGKFGDEMNKVIEAEAAGQTLSLSCQKVKAAKAVVSLLMNVQKTTAKDAEEEADNYEKFEHWCKKTRKLLNKNMGESKAGIEKLDLSCDGKKQQKTKLTREIGELAKELDGLAAASAEALKAENDRIALYTKSKADFEGTISALGDAIKAMVDSGKPAELAQIASSPLVLMSISQQEQEMLLKLQDSPLTGAPKSRDYDFKSGGIINMFKNLKTKFGDEMAKADSEAALAKNEYDAAKGSRDMTAKFTTESKSNKEESLATAVQKLTADTSSLESLKQDLKADSTNLEDTTVQCKMREAEFKERSWQRQQEMDAMGYAVQKLQETVTSFVQTPPKMNLSAAFLERRAAVSKDWAHKWDDLTEEKAPMESARDHFARLLAQGAKQTSKGPVSKKIDMSINKNIWSLREQQQADDKKMAKCNTDISVSEKQLEDHTKQIQKTKDELKLKEAKVNQLTATIDENTQKLAEEFKALHEAKMLRQETKMENKMTIEDYQASQEAIQTAQNEIEDFYKDAQAAAAFIQIKSHEKNHANTKAKSKTTSKAKVKSKDPTETLEMPSEAQGSFTGTGGAQAAVVAVLERLHGEFGKMIVTTEGQEEADQANFDKTFSSQEKEKARLTTEKELKTQEATRLTNQVLESRQSLNLLDRQKASVEVYLADLKKECLKTPSAAERKEARDNEIKSLEEAQKAIKTALPTGVFAQWTSSKTGNVFLAPVNEH